jgi:hypothetical protein
MWVMFTETRCQNAVNPKFADTQKANFGDFTFRVLGWMGTEADPIGDG